MAKLHDMPTKVELLEAVRDWLRDTVLQRLEGTERFHTRVAVNVLDIVAREIALGPEQETRHAERLALLGVTDDAELAARIRRRELTLEQPEVVSAICDAVIDKLRVANPRYLKAAP